MRGAASRFAAFSAPGPTRSTTRAITSAPKPATSTASCTTSSRPVFFTDAITAASSHGQMVRRSSRSTLMPSAASSSAPFVATGTAADHVTTVAASPSLTLRATPNGIGSIGSLISPFTQNKSFGSKNSTGSSERIACTSRPAVSAGVAGVTTITPGRCANHASSICECCAAELRHMPCGMRTTTAGFACPPNM